MNGEVIFVGGIDTEIGKTVVTGWLARQWLEQGGEVITQKLVQTGCAGASDDILLHRRLMGCGLFEEDRDGTTMPALYAYPASPHLAARLEGRALDLGIWLRPFGRLVYAMPPYVIDDEQLRRLCDGMVALVEGLQDEDMRA